MFRSPGWTYGLVSTPARVGSGRHGAARAAVAPPGVDAHSHEPAGNAPAPVAGRRGSDRASRWSSSCRRQRRRLERSSTRHLRPSPPAPKRKTVRISAASCVDFHTGRAAGPRAGRGDALHRRQEEGFLARESADKPRGFLAASTVERDSGAPEAHRSAAAAAAPAAGRTRPSQAPLTTPLRHYRLGGVEPVLLPLLLRVRRTLPEALGRPGRRVVGRAASTRPGAS